MAAQEYTAVVQQLYISYFGRPADYFGLQNFSEQLDALGAPKTFAALQAAVGADVAGTSALSQLVNSFNNSAESVALYGNDNSQIGVSKFVAAIYQNVLGREADATGFNFWVDAIASGTLSKANAAAAITAAASTNTSAQGLLDAQTVANKLSVATTFTAALDTPTEFNAYAGDAAAATGRSLLQGVNNTTVVTDYQAAIDDAINTIVNVSVPGDTKSLTAGVDTLVGTAGDDVFNATPVNATGTTANTLTTFDSIDGGAGKDTLNIYTDGTSNILQAGTVKNVETINIFNAEAGTVYGGAAVDASKFVGATAVWQIGRETAITNVGASTTAGFRAIAQADVAVTASAATVGIALDNVTGANATNASIVTVDGTKLTSVTLSGALVENETYAAGTGTDEASVALNATIAKDAQTFTLNSALNTTLTVDNAATSTKDVTTIAAAASTGNITFVGGAAVSSITTGTGDDTVTLATALTATTKAATVNTGDGDDTITVTATGAADAGSTVTVNAGAGDDEITVALNDNVKYNISGGAGDDLITLTGTIKTGDIIDGGEGKDTIGVAGKTTGYVANDYLAYTKVLKNFEAIKFTTATTGFDASQVAGFKEFTFDSTGTITKVAADQIVTTGGATLDITAAGYTAAGATGNASSTVYSTDTATGALTVNVVESAIVTAKGASIALTVTADSNEAATTDGAANVLATLRGDVKTATVNLVNGVDADDAAAVASVNVTTAATAAGAGPYAQLGGLTSLTLTGNGSATVVNVANTKLATVDASALASVDAAGDAAAGLTYTSTNAAAETIKLGAGVDVITLNASVYGGVGAAHAWDTVTGLNLVIEGTGAAATYAEGSDELVIGANGWAAAKFTTTETDLDLVLAAAAQNLGARTDNVDALVFTVAGNTYVFADTGTGAGTAGALDAGDTVVQLTGAVDQDDLIVALGLGGTTTPPVTP